MTIQNSMKRFSQSRLSLTFLILCCAVAWQAAADDRLRGFVTPERTGLAEIQALEAWHVNLIRYTINWVEADYATVDEFMAWLDNELVTNVDPLIATAKGIGAKVLLDLHNPPGGYSDRGRQPQFRLFGQIHDRNGESWQWAFVQTWQKIATRYASETGVWGYELLNEPADTRVIAGVDSWVRLAQKTIAAVQVTDPTHVIIVNPSFAKISKIETLTKLVGPKVYVSVLFYEPLAYTEQGLGRAFKKSLKYPDPRQKLTKSHLQKKLQKLVLFRKKTGARILIHEFGVVWNAQGASAWLHDVVDLFEKFGFDWTYFSYGSTLDVFSVSKPSRFDHSTPTKREHVLREAFQRNTLF